MSCDHRMSMVAGFCQDLVENSKLWKNLVMTHIAVICIFTVRIRRMGEGNVFSLSTSGGGVTQLTQLGGGQSAYSAGGGQPARGWGGQAVGGVSQPGGGSASRGVSRRGGSASRGGQSAGGGVTTRRTVCLLRSCRRTFLF